MERQFIYVCFILLLFMRIETNCFVIDVQSDDCKETIYDATVHSVLWDKEAIVTNIKFNVSPVKIKGRSNDGSRFESLDVLEMNQAVPGSNNEKHVFPYQHLKSRFFMQRDENGLVIFVFYDSMDEPDIISVKKYVASALSNHMKTEEEEYLVYEQSHAGLSHHHYKVTTNGSDKVYHRQKVRQQHDPEHYDKLIHVKDNTVHSVTTNEKLLFPDEFKEMKDDEGRKSSKDFHLAVNITLWNTRPCTIHRMKMESLKTMKNDTLDATVKFQKSNLSFVEANEQINLGLECLQKHHYSKKEFAKCATDMMQILKGVNSGKLYEIGRKMLQENCSHGDKDCQTLRYFKIDLLATVDSAVAQNLVLKFIFKKHQNEEEMHRCLLHFSALKNPSHDIIYHLENMCFGKDRSLHGTFSMEQYQRRACTALGGVLYHYSGVDEKKSLEILQMFHDWLHSGREKEISFNGEHSYKNLLQNVQRRKYLQTKGILLHALGNAGHKLSTKSIITFLNNANTHTDLRHTAAKALRKFNCNESATALLNASLHDQEISVRSAAYTVYKVHPKAYMLTPRQEDIILSKSEIGTKVLKRNRRFLCNLIESLTFDKIITLPGLEWTKKVGGNPLGADFGVLMRNRARMHISPVAMFFEVDVENKAWLSATYNVFNIFKGSFDVFRGEVCFRRDFRMYNLSKMVDFDMDKILGEMGNFEQIKDKVITPIIKSVNSFNKLLDNFKDDDGNLDFSAGASDLLRKLLNPDEQAFGEISSILSNFGMDSSVLGEFEAGIDSATEQIQRVVEEQLQVIKQGVSDAFGKTAVNMELLENLIKDIDIIDLLKNPKKIADDIIKSLKNSPIGAIISWSQGLMGKMNDLIPLLQNLPNLMDNIRTLIQEFTGMISDFSENELKQILSRMIHIVQGFIEDKSADVLSFFEDIVDEITMTSQYAAAAIQNPMSFIEKATKSAEMAPTQANMDIERGVQKIKESFTMFKTMSEDVEEFQGSVQGKLPAWMDNGQDFNFIEHLFDKTAQQLDGIGLRITNSLQKTKSSLDDTQKIQETEHIITKAKDILSKLKNEFSKIRTSADQFRESFDQAKNAMAKGLEAFEDLKHKAESGKEIVQKVFGLKFHPKFPEKTRENCDETCGGCGIYPNIMYGRKGLQLLIKEGQPIASPIDGIVKPYQKESNVVLIEPISDDMKENVIYLSHVKIVDEGDEMIVDAGDVIGSATYSPCQPNFIHMAMVKKLSAPSEINNKQSSCGKMNGVADFLDIGKFFKMPNPEPLFKEECQKAEFKHMFNYIDFDNLADTFTEILNDPGIIVDAIKDKIMDFVKELPDFSKIASDKFEDVENLLKDLNGMTTKFSKKFKKVVSMAKKVTKMVKDKTGKQVSVTDYEEKVIPKVTDYVSTTKFSVQGFIEFLNDRKLQMHSNTIKNIALKLCKVSNGDLVSSSLDGVVPALLRRDLLKHGETLHGSIDVLKNKARHANFRGCEFMEGGLSRGIKTLCSVGRLCSEISCQIHPVLGHLDKTILLSAAFDPCGQNIIIHIAEWQDVIQIPENGHFVHEKAYQRDFGSSMNIKVFFKLEITYPFLNVDAHIKACKQRDAQCWDSLQIFDGLKFKLNITCDSWKLSAEPSNCDSVFSMKIPDFILSLDRFKLPELKVVLNITELLRTSSLKSLIDGINLKPSIDGNEVRNMPDTTSNDDLKKGPFLIKFFEMTYRFYFFFLNFGVGGTISFDTKLDMKVMNGTTSISLEPTIGAAAWFEGGIDIFIAKGSLKLTGYLLETSFNFTIEMNYAKYPIETIKTFRVDLMPVGIKIEGFFKLLWKKWSKVLFEWRAPRIVGKENVDTEFTHDETPPEFEWDSGKCKVQQITERDIADPAVLLEAPFSDPESTLTMHFAVGTYQGGTNIMPWTKFQAVSQTIHLKLRVTGRPLHWTVRASNVEKLQSSVFCILDAYDVTPPSGRFVPSYIYSSHPHKLSATLNVIEDTKLALTQGFNLGYGKGNFGEQVVEWTQFNMIASENYIQSSNALQLFSNPQQGKLITKPIALHRTNNIQTCAENCIAYGSGCSSFNLDISTSVCELNHYINGFHAKLRKVGGFYYYEKIDTGYGASFNYNDLFLNHGLRYYFNAKITNELGFVSYISSDAVVVDFTPPGPGVIMNSQQDIVVVEKCSSLVLHPKRCISTSNLPNHRKIIDGPGSATVFNGHFPGQEYAYTYTRTFLSANWQCFKDNETDIWGYLWAAGTTVCGTDVSPYNFVVHPIHNVYAGNLKLHPGKYFISVRAINNIQHGGPLATTVCHSLPITIDVSPPLMHYVEDVFHDEDFDLLAVYYKGSDPESGVKRTDVGFGETRHDAFIRSYSKHRPVRDGYEMILLDGVDLPEGVPIWVRVRVVNNVEMHTAGHSKQPIMVDKSAPKIGQVFDGDDIPYDLQYQPYNDRLCVQWYDWFDAESGIKRYTWGIGTNTYQDNVKRFTEYEHHQHFACINLNLTHGNIYYNLIKAYNKAVNSRYTNSSSDGVLVDLTDPVIGEVKDGLDENFDMSFSSHAASVYSNWNGFSDPESGITKYILSAFVNDLLQKTTSVTNETNIYEDHSFHLRHKDFVKTKITAVDGATRKSVLETTGYLIDLTPPDLKYADDSQNGLLYQANQSTIHLSWEYEDEESLIEEYKLQVVEHAGGQMLRVFPRSAIYEVYKPLPHTGQMSIILNDMSLKNGYKYSASIVATNYAGLSHKHNTKGFIVDTTPPIISKVYIGLFGSDEKLNSNGQIIHADHNGIHVTCVAFDHESGIQSCHVAVGSEPGKSDVTHGYIDYGCENTGYINGLSLNVTQKTDILYYVTMFAVNGANKKSNYLSSKPIHVYDVNSPGVVYDGHVVYEDNEFTADVKSVAMSFSGFKSPACGIHSYEWALGSSPGYSDMMPFTSNGIVMQNETHGFAKTELQLYNGDTVFVIVRAYTGYHCHEDIIESVSNGILVDLKGPDTTILNINKKPVVSKSYQTGIFINETSDVVYEWEIYDTISIIDRVNFFNDIKGKTSDKNHVYEILDNQIFVTTSFIHGETKILAMQSSDVVNNTATFVSPMVTSDTTPPIIESFRCSDYISVHNRIIVCKWRIVKDSESCVSRLEISVGSRQMTDDVLKSEIVPLWNKKWEILMDRVTIEKYDFTTYVVTFTAENIIGLKSYSFEKVTIDNTPPQVGLVHISTPNYIGGNTMSRKCQLSQTTMQIEWDKFNDTDSGVKSYLVSIGTSPEIANVLKETEVKEINKLFLKNLPLQTGITYFVNVHAVNNAEMTSTIVTELITISPSPEVFVWDGLLDIDIDYQTDLSAISGQIIVTQNCPILVGSWWIYDLHGNKIQNETLFKGNKFQNDELILHNEQTYFVKVKLIDSLNRTLLAKSNGVSTILEKPYPGVVNDGSSAGDKDYQYSTTNLASSWEGFGRNGKGLKISFYEVSIGTMPSKGNEASDIHYFVNVGLNQSHTFYNLNLTPKIVRYYICVRAHSENGAYIDAFSNGIKVGYTDIMQSGIVDVTKYISSSNEVEISWEGFTSDFEIKYYFVSVSQNRFIARNITLPCEKLKLGNEFTTWNFTNVGKDTYSKLKELNLVHENVYYATIMAEDSAERCIASSSEPFYVDLTPPSTGNIRVEGISDDFQFTTTTDMLHIHWEGFNDTESPIKYFKIQLKSSSLTCDPLTLNYWKAVTEEIDVSQINSHTFLGLNLSPLSVYKIRMVVMNEAGLKIVVESTNILVDSTAPYVGAVKDGDDWTQSKIYVNSTTWINTTIAVNLGKNKGCLNQRPIYSSEFELLNDFSTYSDKSHLWNKKVLEYNNRNVIIDEDVTFELKFHQNISTRYLEGAAIRTEFFNMIEGNYTLDIFPGLKNNYVLSITISTDGYFQEYSTFDLPTVEKYSSDDDFFNNAQQVDIKWGDNNEINSTSTTVNYDDIYNSTTEGDKLNNIITTKEEEMSPGFGFNLLCFHIGMEDNYKIGFWVRNVDGVVNKWIDVDKTFFEQWNRITFNVEQDRLGAEENVWNVNFIVNNDVKSGVSGLEMGKNISLNIRQWSYKDLVPVLEDPFNPFSVVTKISNVKVPVNKTHLCQFGDAFNDNESGIREIYVGIGNTRDPVANVIPVTKVEELCQPCQNDCLTMHCDPTCHTKTLNEFHLLHLSLGNLSLQTGSYESSDDNLTIFVPQKYYAVVKIINGAGLVSFAVSPGFMIDTSPPKSKMLYATDPTFDPNVPVDKQCQTLTMGAVWEFEELESVIAFYAVSVGSCYQCSDIIPFVNVGEITEITIDTSKSVLSEGSTYFVTIKCVNAAGLETITSTNGVSIDCTPPKVENIVPKPMFSSNNTLNEVVLTKNNQVFGLNIVGELDQDIWAIEWSIGTTPDNHFIMESQLLTAGSPHQVEIRNGSLWRDNVRTDISLVGISQSLRQQNLSEKIEYEDLLLEPGRCIYHQLYAVTLANVKGYIKTTPVCIASDDAFVMNVSSHFRETIIKNSHLHTEINGEGIKGELMYGILEKRDWKMKYINPANATFTSYIVDPNTTYTKTTRLLKNRIQTFKDVAWFLSPLGETVYDGPVKIKSVFGDTITKRDDVKWLFWDCRKQLWTHVAEYCVNSVLEGENATDVPFCAETSTHRSKRMDRTSNYFIIREPVMFGLFSVLPEFQNTNPELITDHFNVICNGKLEDHFIIHDNEGDSFQIILLEHPNNGSAEISKTGSFLYIPQKDFFGEDHFVINILELSTIEGMLPSVQMKVITVSVTEIPLAPILLFEPNPAAVKMVNASESIISPLHRQVTLKYEGNTTVKELGYFIQCDPNYDDVNIMLRSGDLADKINFTFSDVPNGYINKTLTQYGCKTDNLKIFVAKVQTNLLSHGNFTATMISRDSFPLFSQPLQLKMEVLINPCIYGYCSGEENNDPGCTSAKRTASFDGYQCACIPGYNGSWCESEINECLIDPCGNFFSCSDFIAFRECAIKPLTIAAIVIAGILLFAILGFGIWYLNKRLSSKHPSNKLSPEISDYDSEIIAAKEDIPWWKFLHKKSKVYPTKDEDTVEICFAGKPIDHTQTFVTGKARKAAVIAHNSEDTFPHINPIPVAVSKFSVPHANKPPKHMLLYEERNNSEINKPSMHMSQNTEISLDNATGNQNCMTKMAVSRLTVPSVITPPKYILYEHNDYSVEEDGSDEDFSHHAGASTTINVIEQASNGDNGFEREIPLQMMTKKKKKRIKKKDQISKKRIVSTTNKKKRNVVSPMI